MSKKKKPFEITKKASAKDSTGKSSSGRSGAGRSKNRSGENLANRNSATKQAGHPQGFFADAGVRETIESIVVAVILALLFRAYEAEAFVIPTGSMAPTLQGRHVDIFCEECGYNFRVGASGENPDRKPMQSTSNGRLEVNPDAEWYTGTATCPICRHTHSLKRNINGRKSNQDSFYGDRIIVSKFAYELSDPERWDVIVFKYPANPKQNYIKRLIGLPGETIKLEFGNVYVRNDQGDFDIARKPPHKLKAMLQLVDDTFHIADTLKELDWPSRWDQWGTPDGEKSWTVDTGGNHPSYSLSTSDSKSWLRYKHLVPRTVDWVEHLSKGELPPRLEESTGQLISDFYAYNYFVPKRLRQPRSVEDWMSVNEGDRYLPSKAGVHWVTDLAMESEIRVKSETGRLLLDIVKAGVHFVCEIDVETGVASLSASDNKIAFVSADKELAATPTGKTPIVGPGKFRIRYANCDDKIYLWVNEKVIKFDGPTEYENVVDQFPAPAYSADDPGDAQPIAVGGEGIELQVDRLKVLRDIFYINSRTSRFPFDFEYRDYATNYYLNAGVEASVIQSDRQSLPLRLIFEDPESWGSEKAIDFFSRQVHSSPKYFYELGEDQFMPLGDNSPSSQDARAWEHGHFFDRKYLIGKALFVYWPHAWRQPFFFPNFRRMGFIR